MRGTETHHTLLGSWRLLAPATLLLAIGCAAPPPAPTPTAAGQPAEALDIVVHDDGPPESFPDEAMASASASETAGSPLHPLSPFGLPELIPGFDHPIATLVEHDGWAALHDDINLIPLWVCHRLDADDTLGDADRDDCNWKPDPQLGNGPTATDADYTHSGYARGHQAPANDYSFSQDEICETFYFANCAPQVQNGFNSGIWSTLEARCQDAAVARAEVYIITGPMFYDPVDDNDAPEHDPTLDDDLVEFFVIGENQVAVPTHFYKIVIDATELSAPTAIAFVVENRRHTIAADGPRFTDANTRPIRWIEARTGIDFMPAIEDFGVDPDALETSPAVFTHWPEFAP